MVSSTTNLTLFLGIILFVSVSAFSGLPTVQKNNVNVQKRVPNKQIMSPPRSTTQLNIFGNAFANDDTLGKRDNPGLKKGPNVSEVTINGKPVKAVAGQKVSQVMASARVKMTYSCKKGNCGTCELLINGRVGKACTEKLPSGKVTIQTY